MPSFCVIKQYYDGNYCGMAVSNTMVIYHGISTLETTGIFLNIVRKLPRYLNPRKVGFYCSNLPWKITAVVL
jgi:hypothetical protein